MEKLMESKTQVDPVSKQLLVVLDGNGGKQAVADLVKQWSGLKKLQIRYDRYLEKNGKQTNI
jgi:type I restriction enzyme M protein